MAKTLLASYLNPLKGFTLKNILSISGVAIAATALVTLGVVSPASAAVSIVAPIETANAADDSYYGIGAAVSNDGSLAAATVEYGGVTIYNVAADTKVDISNQALGSGDIGGLTFSPDNNFLYVADWSNDAVIVIDLSDNSIDRTISFPFAPWTLEASRDGAYLYANSYSSGDLVQVDLSDDSLSSSLSVSGSEIKSMCLSADGATLYKPEYDDTVLAINTSDMSVSATWTLDGASETYSCELDNDGNLIVGDYGNSLVFKVTPEGVATSSDEVNAYVYSAVPSCDAIYVADENNEANIPVLDLSSLAIGDALTVDETSGGSGFYGYGGDRSLDGSVIAFSGYYATDGLVLIKSDCGSSSSALPDTGVDTVTPIAAGLGMLVVGAIAIVAIRRRKA